MTQGKEILEIEEYEFLAKFIVNISKDSKKFFDILKKKFGKDSIQE